jgi:hypothetical protein
MTTRCSGCDAETLVSGALHRAGRFRPDDTKFLTLETSDVDVVATMCSECGLIELKGDVAKLRRLKPSPDAAPSKGTS